MIAFDEVTAVCCAGLEIKESTIYGAGMGLFTTCTRRRGDAIGFYAGDFVVTSGTSLSKKQSEFSVEVVGVDAVVVPPIVNGKIDFAQYPMSASNEPPVGQRANLFLENDKFFVMRGVLYNLMAFYAARDVEAGEELTWDYGPLYDRVYARGLPPEDSPLGVMTHPRLRRLLAGRTDAIWDIDFELGRFSDS